MVKFVLFHLKDMEMMIEWVWE